jgi:hypothetical protein
MISVWVSPRPFNREFLFVPVSNKWVATTATYSFGSFRPDQGTVASHYLVGQSKMITNTARGQATAMTLVWVSQMPFDSELLFVPVSNKWVAATTRYSFCQL